MRVLATIEDPKVIQAILAHVGLSSEAVRADPAQPPPDRVADLFPDAGA